MARISASRVKLKRPRPQRVYERRYKKQKHQLVVHMFYELWPRDVNDKPEDYDLIDGPKKNAPGRRKPLTKLLPRKPI